MMGWFGKFRSSGASRHLLPDAEKDGSTPASYSSPHRGEVAGQGRVGEGNFSASNCAIWNDINRALEAK